MPLNEIPTHAVDLAADLTAGLLAAWEFEQVVEEILADQKDGRDG